LLFVDIDLDLVDFLLFFDFPFLDVFIFFSEGDFFAFLDLDLDDLDLDDLDLLDAFLVAAVAKFRSAHAMRGTIPIKLKHLG